MLQRDKDIKHSIMCQDSADKIILYLLVGAEGYMCITVSCTVGVSVCVREASHVPSNELTQLPSLTLF